jgi:gas vesicle protein
LEEQLRPLEVKVDTKRTTFPEQLKDLGTTVNNAVQESQIDGPRGRFGSEIPNFPGLKKELGELRRRIPTERTNFLKQVNDFKIEIKSDIRQLNSDLQKEHAELRHRIQTENTNFPKEVNDLQNQLGELQR